MDWEIIEKISEGSFSNVYKVKHKKSHNIAAFKVIHQALHNERERRRFKQSFISTSKIVHDNCVKMIEWIETGDKIGFIMEYVDGKPISSLQYYKKEKDLNKIISIIIEISKGLRELHSHNLIHRDLKPANILITKDNIIKITDFDLVKIEDAVNKTIDGSFLGTVRYASPEQCTNSSRIDIRSDLYSLGIIFYELITGKVPFDGENFAEIVFSHLKSPLISPKDLVPELPLQVEKIIKKLLIKNPKDRYSSSQELIKDLKKVIGKKTLKFEENHLLPSIFIGRLKPMKILEDSLKKVSKEKGRTVLITGESGIGKTRLLEEFKLELELKQIPIIDIHCRKDGEIYEPLKNVILKIIKLLKFDSDLIKIKILGNLAWDLTKVAPEIKDLDFFEKIEKIPSLKGKESEFRLFDAITNLIKNLIKINYLSGKDKTFPGFVICFDDLQWAEAPIFRWLSYAARNFKNNPIFLISSFRTESPNMYLEKYKDELIQDKLIDFIDLKPFGIREISKMLFSIFSKKVNKELVEEIYKLTGGNPLFIEEIVYHLFDSKKLIIDKDSINIDIEVIKNFKTDTVKKMISKRLNKLELNNRKLLQIAAIAGNVFNIDSLIDIINYDETLIMNYLDKNRIMNLIEYKSRKDNYKFTHDSIRETLISEIELKRKKKIHLKIALKIEKELLIDKNKYEENIEKLAFHFWKAGNSVKAKKYCLISGDLARDKYANEKAIAEYQKVIDISKKDKDIETEIKTLMKLGNVIKFIGKFDKYIEVNNNALLLAESIEDKKTMAEANLNLGFINRKKAKNNKAKEFYQKAADLYIKINDENGYARTIGGLGLIYFSLYDHKNALKYFEKQLKIGEKLNNDITVSAALNNIGNSYCLIYRYEIALKYYEMSLKIRKKIDNILLISGSLINIGNMYLEKSKYDKAEEYYIKCLKICEKTGNKQKKGLSLARIARVYYFKCNFEKSIENLNTSIEISSETGDKGMISYSLGHIAKNLVAQGAFDKAIKTYEKAIEISKLLKEKNQIVSSYCYIAEIYKFMGNYNKSLEYSEKAIKITKELKYSIYLLFCYLNKVEILIKSKKFIEAKKILDENNEIFKKVGRAEDNFKAEIFQEKINFELVDQQKAISKIKGMIINNKDEDQLAELYYTLWDFIKNNIDKKEESKTHAQKALKLYKKLSQNKPDIINKIRFKELSEYLKESPQKKQNINTFTLIQSLTRFMNPETAYNEFLNFLIKDRNADCALLLIKNIEDKTLIGDQSNFDKFIIKAASPEFEKQEINFSHSILLNVLKDKKSILISNALETKDLKNNPSIIGKAFLSIIAISLINTKEEIIGALYLDRRDVVKSPFVEEDMKITLEIAYILTPILIEQEIARNTKLTSEIENLGLFIGKSRNMEILYKDIEDAARVDMITYINGETGTGKELVARALHKLSKRREFPFVAINCSAIPRELAETELFGHEKGSFSGAIATQLGKFELANMGILFLDEIADLPLELQAKLLRVLQNNEIWRVGGQRSISVNARVIVSTHKDLKEEVEKGYFREDLYHRINILKIEVPSLRDRKEDIPLLTYHFLDIFNKKSNKNIKGFTALAINKLMQYEWSGNVRELENKIAKAVVSHHGENLIKIEELFPNEKFIKESINPKILLSENNSLFENNFLSENNSLQEILDSVEKEMVKKSLIKYKWNISKAAKELKITRVRLYHIINKNKLENIKT